MRPSQNRVCRPGDPLAGDGVARYVSWGAGPRASQYLVLGAKARAAMDGRAAPDFDDVRAVAPSVLQHRLVLNFQADADRAAFSDIITLPSST